jgi:hypothetical protein
MARLRTVCPLVCALVVLMAGGVAHAGPILFSYTTTVSPTTITHGVTSLTLAGVADSGDASPPDGTDFKFGTITANPNNAATKVSYNDNYDFTVTITDTVSGMSKMIDITGTLGGSMGPGNQVHITNTFTMPLTQFVTIGGQDYEITVDPSVVQGFNAPGNGANQAGGFTGHITAVPEPASMALLGVGLPLLGGCALLRRRLRRDATIG